MAKKRQLNVGDRVYHDGYGAGVIVGKGWLTVRFDNGQQDILKREDLERLPATAEPATAPGGGDEQDHS